jgi:hypothetical protein
MENKTLKPQTFKKGIKAIFIEPHLGKISEIEVTGGFPALYEMIGCDLVETCRSVWQSPSKNEMMYFDENGRHKKLQFGFQHKLINVDKFNLPFMGNCVIMGRDWNTGEDIDTQLTAKEIGNLIQFYKIEL